MTRTQTTVAGLVVTLAVVAIVRLNIQTGEETTALHPSAPPGEVANITYSFPSIPVVQVFSIYAALAKEKLIVPDSIVSPGGAVRVNTPQPITRTQALKLLETTLAEQAQITIMRSTNGSLVGIPTEKTPRPPAGSSPVRTYLPDGKIDPPFPPGPKIVPFSKPPVSP